MIYSKILLFFHILFIFIFLSLTIFAIYQKRNFIVEPAVIIANDILGHCLVSFMYEGEKIDLVMPYSMIGVNGTYKTDVAFQVKNNQITNLKIIGSKNQFFLGTNFKIILYGFLSIISFLFLFVTIRKQQG